MFPTPFLFQLAGDPPNDTVCACDFVLSCRRVGMGLASWGDRGQSSILDPDLARVAIIALVDAGMYGNVIQFWVPLIRRLEMDELDNAERQLSRFSKQQPYPQLPYSLDLTLMFLSRDSSILCRSDRHLADVPRSLFGVEAFRRQWLFCFCLSFRPFLTFVESSLHTLLGPDVILPVLFSWLQLVGPVHSVVMKLIRRFTASDSDTIAPIFIRLGGAADEAIRREARIGVENLRDISSYCGQRMEEVKLELLRTQPPEDLSEEDRAVLFAGRLGDLLLDGLSLPLHYAHEK